MKKFLKPGSDFSDTDYYKNIKYEKPSVCPHCGFGTDAVRTANAIWNYFDNSALLLQMCKCTSCGKLFFFASHKEEGASTAKLVCVIPNTEAVYKNEILEKISPRFINMYNQALRAENRQDIELAATGYRSAMEILIKDYAINELNEPKEQVTLNNLNNAIGKYLKQEELVNSADVIRVLGNDFTHYDRKYPEHDFDILKTYMDIFITLILANYKAKHPPIGRNAPKE